VADPGSIRPDASVPGPYLKMKSALFDRNTGLYAYFYHFDDLQALVERRPGLGVLHLEVFHLDRIERLCGWETFDRVIMRMAGELRALRGVAYPETALLATCGRHGGRFVLFIPENFEGSEVAPGDLEVMTGRIRRELLETLRRELPENRVPEADLGVGHALIRCDPVCRLERLVYRAIEEARELASRAADREEQQDGAELRQIIRAGLVETYFQPIVEVPSLEVHGYEALTRGPLNSIFETPTMLFGFSERMKISPLLDSLCRRRALYAVRNMEAGKKLFLNSLPETLSEPGFADHHEEELLANAHLSAPEVVLEITERTGIADFEGFGRRLGRLRDRGYQVAIDDVGTGYSSLQIISEVRPDYLKLDLSLVKNIHRSLIKREIVSSMLQFGDRIGARIVAEGIETEEEYQAVKGLGVHLAQGYYFGAPAPTFLWRAAGALGDH
jgi:EAL domain-containing protein (putative c-di-GMP-specific phosphodiesterase class I)/GGDEF domain-containing protein